MTCEKCSYRKNCRHQCMNLPDGKKCADCKYINWCQMVYGAKPESTKCDFEPIRFKQMETHI